jgi:hypothetical protein
MAKTNTRKYLIYGSIAAIVGVVVYYIWKGSKKDDKPKDETPAPDNDGNQKDGNIQDNKGKSDGGGASSGAPAGLDIEKFQTWIWNRVEHTLSKVSSSPDKYNSTLCSGACDFDSGVDGKWGTNTAKAWGNYKQYWDISKNQPTAEGDKKFPKGGSKDSGSGSGQSGKPTTTQQSQDNKKSMDALVFSFTGNTAATPLVDSSGRILLVKFHITWGTIKDYKIVFFEMKSGKRKPYFKIQELDSNKLIREGSWEYLNNTPKFTPTLGKYANQTIKGASVLGCLKLLLEERLASTGGVIKWGEY